ncbi:hypothetical protein SAMN05421762_1216 [Pseudooceanicola nitratireducens]|jgi:hypothetical protein|uniref:Uncharacterized protein n=1 Tax=Pseudooceanicola nitratireducens TaxID=517719 RepID=A0A1I1JVP2_9RHOB|nr:hypothetical protein [Pseudooceanicola nitratireducens]SEJ51446.1 hypothetical protein SAMN05216183_103576 [Pseudooceanicola nitratireducens]SFC52644.1 hypothetical protein SAMN05421762_1216 [Pseudooceanicola nitratireducens]
MCLTTQALMLFMNLLPPEIVELGDDRIIVRAETRDAIWVAKGDEWCTNAPKLDRAIRFKQGEPA